MMDLNGKRWVYWLDQLHPGDHPKTFRVSIVVENESGHYPTGGGEGKAPWYWDEKTCQERNLRLGFSVEEAYHIVCSSMFNNKTPPKEKTSY